MCVCVCKNGDSMFGSNQSNAVMISVTAWATLHADHCCGGEIMSTVASACLMEVSHHSINAIRRADLCFHVFVFHVCFCGAPQGSVPIRDIIYEKKKKKSRHCLWSRWEGVTNHLLLNQEEWPHTPWRWKPSEWSHDEVVVLLMGGGAVMQINGLSVIPSLRLWSLS